MSSLEERQEPLILVDDSTDDDGNGFVGPIILDGPNEKLLFENRIKGNEELNIDPMPQNTVQSIFDNAFDAIKFFASPNKFGDDGRNLSRILAIGKVQSGKTAFFISTISLAFDNGYRIAYLIGGTKNTLRDQNFERIESEFSNNDSVKVLDFSSCEDETIARSLAEGKNVVLVVLKNAAKRKNLGALKDTASTFFEYPTVIVDDEGDEYSPGAPQSKKRDNATHSLICSIVGTIKICTYLSITATPQANLLIGIDDELSPDYCVLVRPGQGYVGGIDFHDSVENPHIERVNDSADFSSSVPSSFASALRYFVVACCIEIVKGDFSDFSMLVNPSRLTYVQRDIVSKVSSYLEAYRQTFLETETNYEDELSDAFMVYKTVNPESNISLEDIIPYVRDVVRFLEVYQYNSAPDGQLDIAESHNPDNANKYKIFVGGNMLGRGLTIKNLIVTYIYNDSKKIAIDTLYQRARWLGYKGKYFDVCRVYLTSEIQEKFIGAVESEEDMWNSISSFLEGNFKLKEWPRIFYLNDTNKLMLTRRTISKTVTVERVKPGFTFDKSIRFPGDGAESNRLLSNSYRLAHPDGYEVDFATNVSQRAFVIKTKYTEFYENFLKLYVFPKTTKLGSLIFEKMNKQVSNGEIPNDLFVLYLRYKTGEFRELDGSHMYIKELPQGRNDNTLFTGDRNLTSINHDTGKREEYSNKFHVQIHMVYFNHGQNLEDAVPLLALNSPITKEMIGTFVTGENFYG